MFGLLIYSWKVINMIHCALVVSIIGFVLEIIAVSIFTGVSSLTFQEDCRYIDVSTSARICGDSAAQFEIIVSVINFLFYIAFWVLHCGIGCGVVPRAAQAAAPPPAEPQSLPPANIEIRTESIRLNIEPNVEDNAKEGKFESPD